MRSRSAFLLVAAYSMIVGCGSDAQADIPQIQSTLVNDAVPELTLTSDAVVDTISDSTFAGQDQTDLASVVDSLRAGRVCVTRRDESLELCPPDEVGCQVKASRKANKESIAIKLSWRTRGTPEDDPADLQISSRPATVVSVETPD